jgi:hypothetical protein
MAPDLPPVSLTIDPEEYRQQSLSPRVPGHCHIQIQALEFIFFIRRVLWQVFRDLHQVAHVNGELGTTWPALPTVSFLYQSVRFSLTRTGNL